MNTAPFSTALLTCVWLKEPISKVDIIAMFGAYFGIVIVTLKSDGNSSNANLDYQFGTLIMILVAFGMSVIAVSTRRLKMLNFLVIQIYYGLVASVTCGAIIAVRSSQGKTPFGGVTVTTWLKILTAGLLNVVAQNLMTISN